MNVRENLIRRIKDTLAIYAVRIDLDKGEASRAAENFYCGLLNILKGYHLRNMNLEKPNYPAIDLGDAAEGLGVQVTSTATRQKVQDTLDAMFRNGVQTKYPHLVMLVTKEWRDSRKAFRMDGVCRFDPNADIWDTNWLLAQLDGIEALEKLEEIRDYLTKHLHLVREPAPALNLPLQSAMAEGAFVGREKELAEIAKRFETEHIVVLSGLGGMGKTELAVKFGREYQESGRGWAYFLHFSGSFGMTLRSNVHRIIPDYSMTGKTDAQIEADALAALNRGGKEDLLVLDNADSGSMTKLRRELSALRMRVLVTSRQESDHVMRLGRLSDEELFGLFHCHGAELEKADMRELIEAVDGHTMTVELMARLLRRERRGDTLNRLKKALSQRDLASGEFGRTESAYHASPDQARINEHLKAVFRVSDMSRAEKTVLRFATLIGESGLDSEMFVQAAAARWRNLLGLMLGTKRRTRMRDLVQELADKGWLMWKGNDIRIHPVIRLVCMEALKKRERVYQKFLYGLQIQYDENHWNAAKFRQMAEVFETASNVLKKKTNVWARWAGHLWEHVALFQSLLNIQRDSELIAEGMKERHQPDSTNLAASCNVRNLGGYEKELEYKLKGLGNLARGLPPDHPDLADSYLSVGITYYSMGDYEKALEYTLKGLEIQEHVLPEDHSDIANSYELLRLIYKTMEDHEKELEYDLKALAIQERVLPLDHPDLEHSYAQLSYTYRELGNHEKELEYELKALAIRERMLPEDHPHLATSYNNVGYTYDDLGEHQKALEYHMKALVIRERVLPEDHPDLATSYNDVGYTYGKLGDHEKELEYDLKALEIRERVLPGNHPDLAQSFNNIAMTYYDLGRIGEAANHMRRAADIINRSTLPEDHPDRMRYNKRADRFEREARQARGGA